jgi:hypothetical protein
MNPTVYVDDRITSAIVLTVGLAVSQLQSDLTAMQEHLADLKLNSCCFQTPNVSDELHVDSLDGSPIQRM